jgi:hypothetical protein
MYRGQYSKYIILPQALVKMISHIPVLLTKYSRMGEKLKSRSVIKDEV